MNFKEKFDFCLIHSPYNHDEKSLVFVTSRGLEYIDETITMDEDYRKVKSILENHGLVEIEFCSFESIDKIDDESLIVKLEDRGVRYSKSLEMKIFKEMKDLKNSYSSFVSDANYNSQYGFSDPNSKIELDLTKVRIPEMGEKMSLYFYLFLECHFISEENCILLLNGEFYTNETNHFRNFLNIAKSDFVRIESETPNTLVLQSTKKYKDFASEVDLLHSGEFKFIKPYMTEIGQKGYKTKEYQYNFVEIKKNINPEHHIIIQVSLDGYFNQMIERSKEIKRESLKTNKKTISLDAIRAQAAQIKDKLETKMIDSAGLDQYERASYFKNNINLLDSKLKIINNIEEESISLAKYMKIFSLN
jgi:hypothetical protein